MREWWGDRLQFGIIALPAGRTSWFALAPTAVLTGRQQDGPGGLALYRSLFAGFPSPVEDLLARTTPESTVETELRHRPWRGGRGRVTLLRDAAHPMLPHLGQGAGQAVEDAAVLARRLDATPGTASAFRAYEAERRARVRWIQNQALRMNKLGRLPAGPLSSLRDLAMASLPGPAERFAVRRMFDGPPP